MAFWAAAFVIGAYLGYKIAEGLEMSGLAVLGVIVGVLLVAAILGTLTVIAVIAALQPGGRGRSTAWATILAGVLLIAGIGTGWLLKELGLFGYRPSVVLEAPGTMTMSLDGIDGYAGQVDALALCRSEPDAERVAFVEANAIGRIGTGAVGVSVVILPQSADDRPAVQVWIVPADKTVGPAPSCVGPRATWSRSMRIEPVAWPSPKPPFPQAMGPGSRSRAGRPRCPEPSTGGAVRGSPARPRSPSRRDARPRIDPWVAGLQ